MSNGNTVLPQKEFKNLMIDLETMGNTSYSAIVSIAAVEFDLVTGETGRVFYEKVSLKSAVKAGLKMNPDTVVWWLAQSEEARKELTNKEGSLGLREALKKFGLFCKGRGYKPWGNSARFDLGILANAYEVEDLYLPWHHMDERDVRTLVAFNPKIKEQQVRIGIAHNPVDDCLTQIAYCSKTWNWVLNQGKPQEEELEFNLESVEVKGESRPLRVKQTIELRDQYENLILTIPPAPPKAEGCDP